MKARTHRYFGGELILLFLTAGWLAVGLHDGIIGKATVKGNVFTLAATYLGSWQVLVGVLSVITIIKVIGILANIYWLRLIALGMSIILWGFVALGLTSRGTLSTATFGYIAFSALALITYRSLANSPHKQDEQERLLQDNSHLRASLKQAQDG